MEKKNFFSINYLTIYYYIINNIIILTMSIIYIIICPLEDSLPYAVFSNLLQAKQIVDKFTKENRCACIFEYNMNDTSYRKNIYDNGKWDTDLSKIQ